MNEGIGEGFLYRYASPGSGDTYALNPCGRATLTSQVAFDLLPGAVCASDSETVHRVIPIELPLVTLFLQGPPDRNATTVVSPTAVQTAAELPIERLDSKQWRECVATHLPPS